MQTDNNNTQVVNDIPRQIATELAKFIWQYTFRNNSSHLREINKGKLFHDENNEHFSIDELYDLCIKHDDFKLSEAVNNYSKLVEENRHLTEENAAQTSMLMEAEGEKELLVEENERLQKELWSAQDKYSKIEGKYNVERFKKDKLVEALEEANELLKSEGYKSGNNPHMDKIKTILNNAKNI